MFRDLQSNLTRPATIVIAVGMVAAIATAAVVAFYDVTAAMVVPAAFAIIYIAICYPFAAYLMCLAMLSLIPIEDYLFGFFIPNWTQGVIPLLFLSVIGRRVMIRNEERLQFRLSDTFVLGFIVLGYASIRVGTGPQSLKFFTNQAVFPAMLYFIARWMPLDRGLLRTQLRVQLLAAATLALIMTKTTFLGWDPVYIGGGMRGIGAAAIGPMKSISDSVAYMAIWPALFLYASASELPFLGRWSPRKSWAGIAILGLVATIATTERTAFMAIGAVVVVCLMERHLRRSAVPILILGASVIPVWLLSPYGQSAYHRMTTINDEGTGFERGIYRQKAWNYIHSPKWNPVLGTGFGRLLSVSKGSVSETEMFWDYNHEEFRPLTAFAARPIHCAPLSMLGEYGYGGMSLLGLTVLSMLLSIARLPRLALQRGRRVDWPLLASLAAAYAGIVANGIYHNTDSVVPVLCVIWSFAGTIIGHADALLADPEEVLAREPLRGGFRAVTRTW